MIEVTLAGGPLCGQTHLVHSLAEPIFFNNDGAELQYVHELGSWFTREGRGSRTNEQAHFFHSDLAASGIEAMTSYLEVNRM